jgi:phosphatidylglycerol lysyltransferase
MRANVQYSSVNAHVIEQPFSKVMPLDLYKTKKRFREIGIDMFTQEERIGYLKKYGNHCMSFSHFQQGMSFFDVSGIGYIAYMKKWGARYVLADPVCAEKDREYIIGEFLKDKTYTAFIQISEPVAELIHDKFGLYSSQFGIESIVDLKTWDLKGKKKQVLRTSINKAQKDGVRFAEMDNETNDDELTKEWMSTRAVKNKEVVFLIRPKDQNYQEGTRKFYAFLDNELLGYIHFDPIYENGKILGYVPNISRFSPKFKQGIFYPLMVHAIETFKSEGVPSLYLGISPAYVDEQDKTCESKIFKFFVRQLYKFGNWVYSFQGLHFTKSRFQGKEVKTFCAHAGMLPTRAFLTVFHMCNII